MCGIVGYTGDQQAQDILLGGLRRMEYRGYDSAGIVTINDGPHLLRAKGKVAELDKIAAASPAKGHVGIGHTRWATHGEPSEKKCSPTSFG